MLCFYGFRLADLKDFKKVNEIYAKCEYTHLVFMDPLYYIKIESYVVFTGHSIQNKTSYI